jgi:predicted HicB family RNase H-like nuclease
MMTLKVGKELYKSLVSKANEKQVSVKRLIILILTEYISNK